MSDFIQIKVNNKPQLINLQHVLRIEPNGRGKALFVLQNEEFSCDNYYESVIESIEKGLMFIEE